MEQVDIGGERRTSNITSNGNDLSNNQTVAENKVLEQGLSVKIKNKNSNSVASATSNTFSVENITNPSKDEATTIEEKSCQQEKLSEAQKMEISFG